MKNQLTRLIVAAALLSAAGCTRIVKIEPNNGRPGTPVHIKCSSMYGDPAAQMLLWDGHVIRRPFAGSFTVPAGMRPWRAL